MAAPHWLVIIEKEKKERTGRLDLGRTGLTSVPEEIWEMTWVTELILGNDSTEYPGYENTTTITSNNGISNRLNVVDISFSLAGMSNLKLLALNDLQLGRVPVIPNLNSLEVLDLDGNAVSVISWEICNYPVLKTLYLGNNNLTRIENLESLRNLEVLHLNLNQLKEVNNLQNLEKLRELVLVGNWISVIAGIPESLQMLDISENRIENMGSLFSCQLTSYRLAELRMAKNNVSITDFPLEFNNLQKIDLSDNKLTELHLEKFCNQVKILKLSNNQVSIIFAASENQLNELRSLDISYNKLTEISGLETLQNIREINLSNNQIKRIEHLDNNKQLEVIHMAENKITEIKNLDALENLRELNLGQNEITEIKGLEKLTKLKKLYLNYNGISKIENLDHLGNLEVLYLNNNKITRIGNLETVLSKSLTFISINDNPLENIDKGTITPNQNNIGAIQDYFAIQQSKKQKVSNDIVKMIFIGNSNAGKTNLVMGLRDDSYNDNSESTHGIKCEKYKVNDNLDALVWDFGGQEYYHATHHLFFKNYAVYVLVWEKATNVNDKIVNEKTGEAIQHYDYLHWLGSIYHFANEDPAIFIVQNKIDMINPASPAKDNSKQRVEVEAACGYNIGNDFYISLKSAFPPVNNSRHATGFAFLKQHLDESLQKEAGRFEILKIEKELREQVSDFFEADLSVTRDEFKKKCVKKEPGIEEFIDHFISYLDGIGYILYYKDSETLKDKVFVNPIKITELIYDLLDKSVLTNGGYFETTWVEQVISNEKWKNYHIEKEDMIALMKEFEIIFEKNEDGKTKYIAPQYLSSEEPYKEIFDIITDDLVTPSFKLRFPFYFTNALLYRFIIRHCNKAVKNIYWKYGFLFSDGSNRVLIRTRPEKKLLEVFIKSNDPSRPGIRNIRRELFLELINLYLNKNFGFTDMTDTSLLNIVSSNAGNQPAIISTPVFSNREFEKIQLSVDGKYFIKISQLSVMDKERITGERIDNTEGQLEKLLWLADFNDFNTRPVKQPLNVFVSYAHEDMELKNKLEAHLSSLIRSNKIKAWTDHQISPGDQWDEAILANLKKADIILLLVSADFLNSKYIWNKELKLAFEKLNQKQSLVVPVYLRDCDYSGLRVPGNETLELVPTDLYKLQFTPVHTNGNLFAVNNTKEWGNLDVPLNIVAQKIRELVEKKN